MTPPAAAGDAWTEELIYSFAPLSNDTFAYPTVVAAKSAGVLGFTEEGGAAFLGTIFALTPPAQPGGQWAETDLYDFPNRAAGVAPTALIATGGVLYGTAGSGGTTGSGVVFSLTPPTSPGGAWTETVLYNFSGGSDGDGPNSLLPGAGGVLYSTTSAGGNANNGVVFSLTPPAAPGGSWSETLLYAFNGGSDGSGPVGITVGSGGVLYGATSEGGSNACPFGCGTVFSLTPPIAPGGDWTEAVLYSLTGENDGYDPLAGVTIGGGGVLYGTTGAGDVAGNSAGGVVFSLTPPSEPGGAWTEVTLHNFASLRSNDGQEPDSRLLLSAGGVLYGTALLGGFDGEGTVFELKP
jgi:hypothetical protein